MSCPICEKRKAARFCPAKGEKICAVCCGTEREITIDCPSDCSYLIAAHRYEDEHQRSLPADTPLLDEKIPQDIVYTHQQLMAALASLISGSTAWPSTLSAPFFFSSPPAASKTKSSWREPSRPAFCLLPQRSVFC